EASPAGFAGDRNQQQHVAGSLERERSESAHVSDNMSRSRAINKINSWFLDGFAPSKNPEMWTPEVLASIAHSLAPDGTLATFTAAGEVRRALEAAGLTVDKRKGFGHKRHMTVAR